MELDLGTAAALKLPSITSPRVKAGLAWADSPSPPLANRFGHAHVGGPTGPWGHRKTDVFCNSGRFQTVSAARSQGEVYIHESDHGHVDNQSPRLMGAWGESPASAAEARAMRGSVSGRTNAARRISEYRATHAHPVREPFPERVPAVPLWTLSEDYRKLSRLSRRISPGSRAPFTGPLLTSTAQIYGGSAVNLSPR